LQFMVRVIHRSIFPKLPACANFLYRYFDTVFSHVCPLPFAFTIWLYDIDVSTAILT
jgi:hypothetical protein